MKKVVRCPMQSYAVLGITWTLFKDLTFNSIGSLVNETVSDKYYFLMIKLFFKGADRQQFIYHKLLSNCSILEVTIQRSTNDLLKHLSNIWMP